MIENEIKTKKKAKKMNGNAPITLVEENFRINRKKNNETYFNCQRIEKENGNDREKIKIKLNLLRASYL